MTPDTRLELLNNIMDQQLDTPVDLTPPKEEK